MLHKIISFSECHKVVFHSLKCTMIATDVRYYSLVNLPGGKMPECLTEHWRFSNGKEVEKNFTWNRNSH